jgi:hypothetical protein
MLDVRGDECRTDLRDVADAALLAPAEEIADGSRVGAARVGVADVGGEELYEPPGRPITLARDHRRHSIEADLGATPDGGKVSYMCE